MATEVHEGTNIGNASLWSHLSSFRICFSIINSCFAQMIQKSKFKLFTNYQEIDMRLAGNKECYLVLSTLNS